MSRKSQRWIFDALLRTEGLDVLHPEGQAIFEEFGHNHVDLDRVYARAKAGVMVPRAWWTMAQITERKAKRAESEGFKQTAKRLYFRAALLYGRAQYAFFSEDPKKAALHSKMKELYWKSAEYNQTPIERVEIPFEGHTIYATLHLPTTTAKVPCVLMVPGMDMIREDWHNTIQTLVVPRGMAAIAIDGPGQGESRLHGLKVSLDNYERAASKVIDFVVERPEIDPDRVVLMGISMGSYWGTRTAAYDSRIKAAATGLACYTVNNQNTIFNVAQPNFKFNFMHMSGIYDEDQFDDLVTRRMGLRDVATRVRCPILFLVGEYDELTPLEESLGVYELIKAPKELWLYEDEFHPMANSMGEMFSSMLDWLEVGLEKPYKPGMDRRVFVGADGNYTEGTGKPTWWPAL